MSRSRRPARTGSPHVRFTRKPSLRFPSLLPRRCFSASAVTSVARFLCSLCRCIRLMFPVIDGQGRPVAFGGRVLDPEGEPKYLNSPETAAYTKGRHLYGLNLTRDEVRRQGFAILVEGYLDLIVPYQIGVRNVVASLGTALTPEQVKLIGRFARKVVVNYDGDRAGVQAAKRAIETLLTEDLEVKVLALPDNADPDAFIRKRGVTRYQQ